MHFEGQIPQKTIDLHCFIPPIWVYNLMTPVIVLKKSENPEMIHPERQISRFQKDLFVVKIGTCAEGELGNGLIEHWNDQTIREIV